MTQDISRRKFLYQVLTAAGMCAGGTAVGWHLLHRNRYPNMTVVKLPDPLAAGRASIETKAAMAVVEEPVAMVDAEAAPLEETVSIPNVPVDSHVSETEIRGSDIIAEAEEEAKMRERVLHFNEDLNDDVWLDENQRKIFDSLHTRIGRVQKTVGYGNFNILSFDEMLKVGDRYVSVESFTKAEKNLLDELFFRNAQDLGFFGEKVTASQTASIKSDNVVKVPGSGHYLYKGDSEKLFNKLCSIVGDDLILTSGIRSVAKQYHLYTSKVVNANYNLSRASRSLAPPGYSYHAIGDFDVGQRNWGLKNFTSDFADSDVFKELISLGYIRIRYTIDNNFGVRFEPWHIRVV
ncbi:M15 family metallopeptidase [Gynuella sp.]|uniref:M15 family metallopeptidase n=1 Tax=Gynuella sp. TaxID=2969146 RepID=UPI003D10ADEC